MKKKPKATFWMEMPPGTLGAAAMAAFHMTESACCAAFAKGNLRIDHEPMTARHVLFDADPYRGRYLHFHGRQALLVGHALVRDNEQLELKV
jgi:hypothetical protein